jgi:collagenase-like PrtC family protease
MKITIGPATGSFGPQGLQDLYREVASSPADEVYLGELACEKREHRRELLAAAHELRAAGKVVHAASPAIHTPSRTARGFESLAEVADDVEINSPAFLPYAAKHGRWVAGPFLNIYNAGAAEFARGQGAFRIVAPAEFGGPGVRELARGAPVEIEVIVHGQVPVGLSAMCLSAKAAGRPSRACAQVCLETPEGLALESDGDVLFRIDGPLTLSGKTWCLVRKLSDLNEGGVRAVRIMPVPGHTGRIAAIFRSVLDGRAAPSEAASELESISPGGLTSTWGVGARREQDAPPVRQPEANS